MSDVSFIVLRSIDRRLRAVDLDLEDALEGTGLSRRIIDRSRRARVDWPVFLKICDRIGEMMGGAERAEQLGVGFVDERPGVLQILASRYLKPQTLYYLGVRWYGPSMMKGARAQITLTSDGLIKTMTLPESGRECPTFYAMAKGAMRAAPTLVGWPMADVELRYHKRESSFQVRFVPPDGAPMDVATLQREVDVERGIADAFIDEVVVLGEEFESSSSGDATEAGASLPLTERVRRMLEEWPGRLDVPPGQAARRLGMSERSLARGLSRESSSYSQLRDEIRRDVAIDRLARGERIEDVSEHLGFADVSSFHRAFRRWTGRSPGSYLARR